MGLRPCQRRAPWAALPGTRMRNVKQPALALTIAPAVGSGISAELRGARCSVARSRSRSNVPAPPSSSALTRATTTSPGSREPQRASAAAAMHMAATPDFMSLAPRPCSTPSRHRGLKSAASGAGTTSVWPRRSRSPALPSPVTRPTTRTRESRGTSMPGKPGASASMVTSCASTSRPSRRSQPAAHHWTSASAAVPPTEGMAIRSAASWRSCGSRPDTASPRRCSGVIASLS